MCLLYLKVICARPWGSKEAFGDLRSPKTSPHWLHPWSLILSITLYINCGEDIDECFEDNSELLFTILIVATFVMNFIVFQDYLASFIKKWKRRNSVKPANTLSMSKETSSNCNPVDLAEIESHIRLKHLEYFRLLKAFYLVFLLDMWVWFSPWWQ